MISLEIAKALKEAGLVWEPQLYDEYIYNDVIHNIVTESREENIQWLKTSMDVVFLPRLDQILTEIEKRGYTFTIYGKEWSRFDELYHFDATLIEDARHRRGFHADTPDEAAAQALLWILREGNA